MSVISRIFGSKKEKLDLSLIEVDMHSHLIPGIDDGSKNMDETIALLAKFQSMGYRKVITTPHIMSDYYPNTRDIILSGLHDVREMAAKLNLSIEIEAAAEYYFDETLPSKIKEKELLTFGGNHVLVEFAFQGSPTYEDELFFDMLSADYQPVLAHFERYGAFMGNVDKAAEYRDKGVLIQMNLNSLTGHYGPHIKKQAEQLIDKGLVDFVGTDCHRIQHLRLLEDNLHLPYFSKLTSHNLRNTHL